MISSRRARGISSSLLTASIGRSVEGREILVHATADANGTPGGTLLVGGMHGDEWGTVLALESLVETFAPHEEARVRIIPLANPDGLERSSRYNARRVDLNRNFGARWSAASEEPPGPAPWSEPETRALRDHILATRPERIVTIHWALAELDADGPQSTALALAMWEALTPAERAPYRLRFRESPPGGGEILPPEGCPGSMGQWCGYALRYPDGSAPAIVTLELPYDPLLPRPSDPLPVDHLETLRKSWTRDHLAYMAAVEGPVHKMLLAACRPG